MIGKIIRIIGRTFFWKITKEDEMYLKNYYNEIASIDGDTEFARKSTDIRREEILLRKEIKFFNRIRN